MTQEPGELGGGCKVFTLLSTQNVPPLYTPRTEFFFSNSVKHALTSVALDLQRFQLMNNVPECKFISQGVSIEYLSLQKCECVFVNVNVEANAILMYMLISLLVARIKSPVLIS